VWGGLFSSVEVNGGTEPLQAAAAQHAPFCGFSCMAARSRLPGRCCWVCCCPCGRRAVAAAAAATTAPSPPLAPRPKWPAAETMTALRLSASQRAKPATWRRPACTGLEVGDPDADAAAEVPGVAALAAARPPSPPSATALLLNMLACSCGVTDQRMRAPGWLLLSADESTFFRVLFG
jgi:hypothetical protein